MLWNQGGGGGGAGAVSKTCTPGDFFSAVNGSGNFTCATPAGSGDVTAVGDCASGDCFTASSNNSSLIFEGSTADSSETTLTVTDPTADRTITLPNRTGTVALDKVVNLYDYAACDGTNEATGIQAAITAACALGPGGTLYVPADTCVFGSTLTLCSGLAIIGSDGTERSAYGVAYPHELSYSGTGTAIDAQDFVGVRLAGVLLRATSASFAGPLLDADGIDYLHLDRVSMAAATQAGAATCALVSMNDTSDISIDSSSFTGCGYALKARVLSSNYSNVVRLSHNAFYRSEVCSVLNPGGAWEVTNNKWQPQGYADERSSIFCHGAGICAEGLQLSANMVVDQPSGPTVAEFELCGSGLSITGNFFGGNSTQDAIGFSEPCDGCTISGNEFIQIDEPVVFTGTGGNSVKQTMLGNAMSTVATVPYFGIYRTGSGGTFINEPTDIYANVDTDANSGSGAFVIGSNARDSSSTQQYVFLEGGYAQFRRGNDLRFHETDDSNYVQLSAPTLSGDYTLTLPTTDGATNDLLYNTDGSGTLGWRTPNAGTDITADLEEETHATEHSLGGTDAVTVTNLASACTDGQVLGGTLAGTGVECQADVDTNTNAATICAGTTTYLDGEGNCDDIAAVYAPIGATYITQTANATLTNEQAMGALGTGIVINTTTTGVQSIYTGTSCTNQFPRSLNASGAATCASVVSADVTDGTLTADDLGADSVSASELNATGVEAELEAVLDHNDLQGLTTGDPHTQYLALAGRTLSDPGGSVTTIATQTTSSPLAMTNASGFKWLNWDADLTVPNISLSQIFSVNGSLDRTGTSDSLYQFTGFHMATEFTSSTANGPLFQDAFFDASVINQVANTATQNTYQPISFLSKPTYKAAAGASLTIGQTTGVDINPSWGVAAGGTLTNTTFSAFKLHAPNEIGGTLSLPNYIALDVEDLDTAGVTAPMSVRSVGTTTEMRHAGPAIFGATGAPTSGKKLDVQGDTLITGALDVGDSVADPTGSTTTKVVDINDTINTPNPNGNLTGYGFYPTSAQSESNNIVAVDIQPTINQSGSSKVPTFYGVNIAGTTTATTANFPVAALMRHVRTYTSATASATPVTSLITITNSPTVSNTATSGTTTVTAVTGMLHNPTFTLNDTNGATGGVTTMTVTDDIGLSMTGTYTETAGVLAVTNRTGLKFADVTNTSSATAITNNVGVDIAALSTATTNIGIRNADTTVYTPATSTMSAASSTISAGQTVTELNNTSGGALTITAAPTIADGVNGQILYVFNGSANNVVIQDQGTLASSNLRLSATTITLGTRDSITLMYSSTVGDWIQIGQVNVL